MISSLAYRSTTTSLKEHLYPRRCRAKMNFSDHIHSFRVASSKGDNAKLSMLVLNRQTKTLEIYWIWRGQPQKQSYQFEQARVHKAKNPRRVALQCGGEHPWPKQQYFFKTADMCKEFVDVLSPQVAPVSGNKLFIGHAPDENGGNKGMSTQKTLLRKARGLVSKKKFRFQIDGFDLDLSYITPRVIAMGYPCEGKDAMYRNPLPEVKDLLTRYHGDKYRVYNLCSEWKYDKVKFDNGQEAYYPFDDHNPPAFNLIIDFCKDCDEWINKDFENVLAIHCKAGKGRTGTVIACYLLYAGAVTTAADALMYFAQHRTKNAQGVTIPSQRRYVSYFAEYLYGCETIPPPYLVAPKINISKIVISTIPKIDDGGVSPYFVCYGPYPTRQKIYDYSVTQNADMSAFSAKHYQQITMHTPNLHVQGDCRFQFFDAGKKDKKDQFKIDYKKKIFHFWFNTKFLANDDQWVLPKTEVDKARKDKKCKKFKNNFKITLFITAADGKSETKRVLSVPMPLPVSEPEATTPPPPMPQMSYTAPVTPAINDAFVADAHVSHAAAAVSVVPADQQPQEAEVVDQEGEEEEEEAPPAVPEALSEEEEEEAPPPPQEQEYTAPPAVPEDSCDDDDW
jgi:phosphatidylinositol-3,4,5-trisphosphate 3-phosphatase/dual-specificity protein phosphatase PTEN